MAFQRFGSYEILGRIGRGGMATVSLARADASLRLPPIVCLKTLRSEFQTLRDFRLMLVDEAEIASQLTHPNCIKTFEAGEVDGASFISMEYVVGETLDLLLRYAIKLKAPLMPEAVAAILASICDALDYAHRKEMIHRDVSPENIMISDRGVPKLLDFGVAKARDRHQITKTGVFKGKFSYMSPEQLSNEPVDHRCDIYELGVTLYSCLANRRPFEGLGLEDLFVAKIYGTLPPLTGHDRRLSQIAEKAVARRPEDRFSSAKEMATALRACVPAEAGEHLAAMALREKLEKPLAAKRHAFERLLTGDADPDVLKALRVSPLEPHELPFSTDPQANPRRWSSLTDQPHISAELDAFSLEPHEQTDPEHPEMPTMISSRYLVPLEPESSPQSHLVDDLDLPATPLDLDDKTEDNVVSEGWDDQTRRVQELQKPMTATSIAPPSAQTAAGVVERVSLSPPMVHTPTPPPPQPARTSGFWWLLLGLALGLAAGLYAQKLYVVIP